MQHGRLGHFLCAVTTTFRCEIELSQDHVGSISPQNNQLGRRRLGEKVTSRSGIAGGITSSSIYTGTMDQPLLEPPGSLSRKRTTNAERRPNLASPMPSSAVFVGLALCPARHLPTSLTTSIAPGLLLGPSVCGSSVAGMIRRFGRAALHCSLAYRLLVTKKSSIRLQRRGRAVVEKPGPSFSRQHRQVKRNHLCKTRREGCMWSRGVCTTCNKPPAATRLQIPRAVMAAV